MVECALVGEDIDTQLDGGIADDEFSGFVVLWVSTESDNPEPVDDEDCLRVVKFDGV